MPLISFPPVAHADAHGLLAIGGELTPDQVWLAHQNGIFPWYQPEGPILWWAPNPRAVIKTNNIHQSRSLKRVKKKYHYDIRFDNDFTAVIDHCATVHGESWITPEMKHTYTNLHQQGRAHSCELYVDGALQGGLYGVCLHQVFCGESMFSLMPNASKIVLVELCHWLCKQGICLVDAQFLTPHLQSMGAIEISRQCYMTYLQGDPDRLKGNWASW